MNRGASYGGRSKATPTTLCQKCLKRGHYSYECKVTTQERPYKARPSRTQQLLNPNLKPKLTTEVPNELLRKKGVADELLAKKELERGRKSSRDGDKPPRKRSRSTSFDSASTISTNRSRSPSQPYKELNGRKLPHGLDRLGKRGRRSVSSDSCSSDIRDRRDSRNERSTRRRLSSFSPEQRGRRRRSESTHMDTSQDIMNDLRSERRRPSPTKNDSRGRRRTRRRSNSCSPLDKHHGVRQHSKSLSRSSNRMDTSDNRGRVPHSQRFVDSELQPSAHKGERYKDAWESRSPYHDDARPSHRTRRPHTRSPVQAAPPRNANTSRSPSPFKSHNGKGHQNQPDESFSRGFNDPAQAIRENGHSKQALAPNRERSLSPYSKRLAMTRAMQGEQ